MKNDDNDDALTIPKASKKSQHSFYLPQDVRFVIEARAVKGQYSQALTNLLRRYESLISRNSPHRILSGEEQDIIRAALYGVWRYESFHYRAIPGIVSDYLEEEDAEEVGVDVEGLVSKLSDLSYAQLVALADDAEKHYTKVYREEDR